MSKKNSKKFSLSNSIKKLSEIANWFNNQEEVDVEEGLNKIKEAAVLIKAGKKRLKEIENEFEEIKMEMDEEFKGEYKEGEK